MASFETSPRPTKRRKIASSPVAVTPLSLESQNPLPFSTRAFRAVKDVVLGREVLGSDKVETEDELAQPYTQNGVFSGLRKGLSALEIWKMARLQNGTTRGLGLSGNISPARSATRNNTPTSGKRKRGAVQEGNDGSIEYDGERSKKVPIVIVTILVGRKRYNRPIEKDDVNGEKDDEQLLKARTPQKTKKDARTDLNGPPKVVEGKSTGSVNSSKTRRRRKVPQDDAIEETIGSVGNDAPPLEPTAADELTIPMSMNAPIVRSSNQEEAELGLRAIGTLESAPASVAEESLSGNQPAGQKPDIAENRKTMVPHQCRKGNHSIAINGPVDGRLSQAQSQPHNVGNSKGTLEYATEPVRNALKAISQEVLEDFKSSILAGLNGKRARPLVNLDAEYQKIYQLIEQTVLAGEGNSMALIGSRGSAKTTLVEKAVSELSMGHREYFHVIRLNGLIHTDDKLALREIWRQLGKEMDVDDDDKTGKSNYADILASLLALLSHRVDENPDVDTQSIPKSVIFIIDEFDLFASHPRQTLLYNLFDAAQSSNAPIAVLGLTTKLDVVESLEKRVKSRFGQRYVHLSLPRTFATFQSICKAALVPPRPEPPGCTKSKGAAIQAETLSIGNLHDTWTTYIDALFVDEAFLRHLRGIFATTKSIRRFLSTCLLPIASLSPSNIPTTHSFSSPTTSLQPPDSKLHLLPSLSELALSLVIASARLDIILSTDLCNFEMVYEEYVSLASRVKMQTTASGQLAIGGGGGRVWSRSMAKAEWERLIDLELVLPATGGMAVDGRKGEQSRMCRVDVGLEEVGGIVKMGAVMARWCKEI